MRRLLRIVVPVVILGAVGGWWIYNEQFGKPAAAPTRVDPGTAGSPQDAWRSSGPGDESSAIARNPPTAATPAPPAGTNPPVAASAGDAASAPAQLRWDGPAAARGGVPFAVTLRMTSSEQVRVVRMELGFDPSLLEVVSVRAGEYLAGANFGYSVNPNGSIRIGATKEAPGPLADAPLIVITFKPALSAGTAELNFSALHPEGPETEITYESVTPFTTTVTP